jgi:hypothetical protein
VLNSWVWSQSYVHVASVAHVRLGCSYSVHNALGFDRMVVGSTWHHARDKFYQAPPLSRVQLKRLGRLGTRLMYIKYIVVG